MLVRFSVENFMSFNETVSFSMAASKVTRMKDHIITINDKKILKGGYIFGPNASGKSNLIKAMKFAKKIILSGCDGVDFNKKHFRINNDNFHKPGVFQFDIMIKGVAYSYGFAISYNDKEIIAEWLVKTSGAEVYLFSRELQEDGNILIQTDIKNIKNKEDETRFKIYLDDFKNKKNKAMRQTLILTDIANRSSSESEFFKRFIDIFEWFKDIIIIFPDTKFGGLGNIISNTATKELFEEMLSSFDTGVESVDGKEVEFEKLFENIPVEKLEEIKVNISNILDEDTATIKIGKSMFSVQKQSNGEIKATKMVLNHGNNEDLFDCTDESDGTQRLFDLIPLFFNKEKDRIIIIDEIDRSLHSKLTEKFVQLFYKYSKNTNTQLIATTHDSILLDLDLVRQDEIWFIERQKDHSSRIYSLNKFKERFDKRIEKEYLIGRYGAIPDFSKLDTIEFGEE